LAFFCWGWIVINQWQSILSGQIGVETVVARLQEMRDKFMLHHELRHATIITLAGSGE